MKTLYETTRALLGVAAFLCVTLSFGQPIYANETVAYWDPGSDDALTRQQSFTGVQTLVDQSTATLLTQIDGIRKDFENCMANGAHIGGANDDKERRSCLVSLEAAKVEFYVNAQAKLTEISTQLYGVGARYELDIANFDTALDAVQASMEEQRKVQTVLREGARAMVAGFDPENLTEDDERLMRNAVREFNISQETISGLANQDRFLTAKHNYAKATHGGIRNWAFESEMAAADLDINILKAQNRIEGLVNDADYDSHAQAVSKMPSSMTIIKDVFTEMGKLAQSGSNIDVGPAEPAQPPVQADTSDRSELLRALQAMLGEGA